MNQPHRPSRHLAVAWILFATTAAHAAERPWVHAVADGKLQYRADQNGNTIPDFSNCGYAGGGVALPDVPVKLTLAPTPGNADDTARIQKAIDQLSVMAENSDGIRGAIVLKKGTYRISGQLKISASGVVLRGEGDGDDGTILRATGTEQRTLIEVEGSAGPVEAKSRTPITDDYVPVGSRTFRVKSPAGLKVGDTIIVRRTGNKEWIHEIAMDRIAGRPGAENTTRQWEPFELTFDRVITKIQGGTITVDAPITCAIEQRWGGGSVAKYEDPGRIQHVGVERLRAVSDYDAKVKAKDGKDEYASDEAHATYLVKFDNVKNAWLRDCTTLHFYHGPSSIERNAKWVTVQDCKSLEPVSVLTGGRRYPFSINGQLNLVQRCYSRDARHAFVFGSRVCGPNTFLDCTSERDHATSEPHHRWSVGGLYDNVKSAMAFQDRQWMGSGHGWAGANYVVWNCEGSLVLQQPPTAQNWAIGFVGEKKKGAFERPDGYWESPGKHVTPKSLYKKQLEERLGKSAAHTSSSVQYHAGKVINLHLLGLESEATKFHAALTPWDGLGAEATRREIEFNGNKATELTSAGGNRQVIWREKDSAFLCTKVWIKNSGSEELVVKEIVPLTVSVDPGTPLESSRWFGSDGPGAGSDTAKTGYTFLALVDPKTRAGAVAGWLTHERSSGIVVGKREGDRATLAATAQYGRLVIPPGQTAESETFAVGLFDDARLGLEAFADATAKLHNIKLPFPVCGYSTWYHARALDEKRMAILSDWCKANRLDEFGLNFLQIDDQWQIHRRDFTTHKPGGKANYPSGMKATAHNIAKNGFVPGLWLTPFGWQGRDFQDDKPNPNETVMKDHPDWFVKRRDGGSIYWVRWAGDCLDMTHPDARAFLKNVIHTMTDDWGYKLLKIDGLWAGMAVKILYPSPEYRDDGIGDAVFHDPTKTNQQVYRDGLRLVREASGGQDKTFILGCNIAQNMRTMGASIGLVDSMRIGPDIKADWSAVVRCAKPAGWLYFWNGRVWWNDPDCLMLREPLTLELARAWGSFIGLSGQLHVVSEWLPDLPPERLDVLKRSIPNHQQTSARPVDLFERQMPRIWHVSKSEGDSRRDVVGLFNWSTPASATTKPATATGQEEPTGDDRASRAAVTDQPARIRVDLKDLGLPAGRYAAFDFWANKFLDPVEGSIEYDVAPGSCKVIALSRLADDRPQLVSTSRHVTQGMVELADINWDAATSTLRGTSKLVADDPYELRIAAPAGWTLASATSSTGTASARSDGPYHRVAIQVPTTGNVTWELRFTRRAQLAPPDDP